MKIAIIGAGNVGTALGERWAANGHSICFGVRRPDDADLKERLALLNADIKNISDACSDADIVVLATPWTAAAEAIAAAGDLGGRIMVDVTNPLNPGLQGLAVGTETSAAEHLAALAPQARLVKAFNSTGAENMRDPDYKGRKALMLVCGDDENARRTVLNLAAEIGFDAVDAGPLYAARYLEPFAMMWIHLAYKQGLGRDFAFGLLRRDSE